MKMMLIAGVLITLPAILIVIWFFGRPMMVPALASFLINSLPFVVAGYLLRKSPGHGDDGLDEH